MRRSIMRGWTRKRLCDPKSHGCQLTFPQGRVNVHRYEDEPEQVPDRVLEACRRTNPQLIVLGSSEVYYISFLAAKLFRVIPT